MRDPTLKSHVLFLTEGLFSTVTDMVLFLLFLPLAGIGTSKTSYGAYQMIEKAQGTLEIINYRSIKRALHKLSYKGYITLNQAKTSSPVYQITQKGTVKLNNTLRIPKKRFWDQRIYLITYDVPETHKLQREKFRLFISQFGAAMLQKSVWITPYNPKNAIKEFVSLYHLHGTIIISDMGRDATIGDERIKKLLKRIYKLDALNDQYRRFIDIHKDKSNRNPFFAMLFLRILRNDPKLPYELLDKEWLGEKAYALYKQLYT